MTRPVFLLAVALAATSAHTTEDPGSVAFNFQDVDLAVLARFVSEVTGKNLILDERVRGKVSVFSPTRLTPSEAYDVFQSVLAVKGLTTVPRGTHVKIVPLRDAREAALPTDGGGDQLVTRVLPLVHGDAMTLVPVLQPLVSKDGVLTAHADTNRLVVVDSRDNVDRLVALLVDLDHPATSTVSSSIRLQHATAEGVAGKLSEAFAGSAGDVAGLRAIADRRANTVLVSGPAAAVARARALALELDAPLSEARSDLHVRRLRYASADRLVRVLSQLLGVPPPPLEAEDAPGSALGRMGDGEGRGIRDRERDATPQPVSTGTGDGLALEGPVHVTADPATNALIVSAGPRDWAVLASVLDELDVPRRQVFVEAIILEATADKTRALGIELSAAGQSGDAIGLARVDHGTLGPAAVDPTSLPGLILAAMSEQTVTLPNGLQVPAYSALLTALQRDGEVNVLSAPNVVTTDNEEAEIIVGRNVPFIASRATDGTNLNNLFTTIERHDVGITLRMTPQITADDFVRLTLFEEVSDLDAFATAALGGPDQLGPTTTVRSTSTVVSARDGQTIVIGGLIADTLRNEERSVPFFTDIPLLGHLFRREERRRVKTNLLVFLTPHIITSDRDMATRGRAQRAAMPRALRDRPVLRGSSWDAPGDEGADGE
jgi:general secretion pathway protein D